jgi:GNAT superfamily N-acetyltransferase
MHTLAQRLERVQAQQLERTLALTHARSLQVLELAGGRVVFAEPHSPHSTALGVGLSERANAEVFARLEACLGQEQSPIRIELTPFQERSFTAQLGARGYRVERFELVWWRAPLPLPPPVPSVEVRPLRPGEEDTWAQLFFHAYMGRPARHAEEWAGGLPMVQAEGNTCFLAWEQGLPVGVGIASVCERVALLSADGVAPPQRGRGVQRALIRERLAWAAQQGCEVATASTDVATASQRNYELSGFRCAYPKTVMLRPASMSARLG